MFLGPNSAGSTTNGPSGKQPRAAAIMTAQGDASADEQAELSALFVAPGMDDDALALAQARRMLHFIEVARSAFPGLRELADHPGWEIMLQVFVAHCEGRALTMTDLCDLTGCWRPLTVRYVELLVERGMVERDVTPGNPDTHGLTIAREAGAQLKALLCDYARGWAARPEEN